VFWLKNEQEKAAHDKQECVRPLSSFVSSIAASFTMSILWIEDELKRCVWLLLLLFVIPVNHVVKPS
jgi:MFS-type transporter involved in bile tolerance (Atg22 family)